MTHGFRKFTLLGCGSSPGVPSIAGGWGACDPKNSKNRRQRAAFLIEQFSSNGGKTTVLVDTGPDLRTQMIAANIAHIDGVLYTHWHADHLHGIDDLRGFAQRGKKLVDIYAEQETLDRINFAFGYCLKKPTGSEYPPILNGNLISDLKQPIVISGEGGDIPILPLRQIHGSINSLGFKIGNLAYCSDVSDFPLETQSHLKGLKTLIIDCLQYKRHPSHLSLEQVLDWDKILKPERMILTHMHVPLDYETVMNETPSHVEPGYDMLELFER